MSLFRMKHLTGKSKVGLHCFCTWYRQEPLDSTRESKLTTKDLSEAQPYL